MLTQLTQGRDALPKCFHKNLREFSVCSPRNVLTSELPSMEYGSFPDQHNKIYSCTSHGL